MSDQSSNMSGPDLFKVGAPSPAVAARLAQAMNRLSSSSAAAGDRAVTVPDVAAGQLWRARTGKTTASVLVLANSEAGSVRIAPTTFDTDLATDSSRILDSKTSDLGAPFVVWISFQRDASVAVLDGFLGQLTNLPESASDATAALVEAGTPGRRVHTPIDVRAELEAELADEIETLASAEPWQPAGRGDLNAMLADFKASQLAEMLGLTRPDALNVKRGLRPLTVDESRLLAPVVGKPADDLVAAGPSLPAAVVYLFNTPRVRAGLTELANKTGMDVEAARVRAAYEVAGGIAARTTNRTGDVEAADLEMWSQRVRQFFEVKLGHSDFDQ